MNSASSRKPPEHTESTSGPAPTTISAPMRAWMMRSMPSRSGEPGATRRRAARSASDRGGAGMLAFSQGPPGVRTARSRVRSRYRGWCGGSRCSLRRRPGRARRRTPPPSASASVADGDDCGSPGPSASTAGPIARREAEARGLGEAPLGLRDLTDLTAEPDLAERRPSRRAAGAGRDCAGDRERDREVDARLGDAHAAGDAGVHVGAADRDAGPLLEHREEQREARRRRARTRRGAAPASPRTRPVPAPRRATAGCPRATGATTEPGTSGRRSARNSADASGTSASPSPRISNTPSSLVAPNRCFTARRKRNP